MGGTNGSLQKEEPKIRGIQWTPEHEKTLPKGGIFTLETLSKWDGTQLPMCVDICGKVVDVSSSQNFNPGIGYGKLWAGKDCTLAMATVSLKPESANRLDYKLSDFSELQFKSLAGWYKHFTQKYRTLGSLKEYEGWDFSSVFEAAKTIPLPSLADAD